MQNNTIPAPYTDVSYMIVPQHILSTVKFYATDEQLIEDIGKAYQDVIKQFYVPECRKSAPGITVPGHNLSGYVQSREYQSLGVDIEEVKSRLLKVNNLALENRPDRWLLISHIPPVEIIIEDLPSLRLPIPLRGRLRVCAGACGRTAFGV